MSRRLGHVFSFVAAGMIVNLAVTWGCALWSDWPVQTGQFVAAEEAIWPIAVDADWPSHPRLLLRARSFGYRINAAVAYRRVDDPLEGRQLIDYRAATHSLGWPMPALGWTRLIDDKTIETPYGLTLPTLLHRLEVDSQRRLPLKPIWPGFALNPLLFATTALLILRTPRVAIALRRHAKNQCPRCGYPVSDSALCTECGRARGVGG